MPNFYDKGQFIVIPGALWKSRVLYLFLMRRAISFSEHDGGVNFRGKTGGWRSNWAGYSYNRGRGRRWRWRWSGRLCIVTEGGMGGGEGGGIDFFVCAIVPADNNKHARNNVMLVSFIIIFLL